MTTLWTLMVLLLLAGELFGTGWSILPTRTEMRRVYNRETLLALRHKGDIPMEYIPAIVAVGDEPAERPHRRKRGRRGGVRQRLRRRGDKPPLPSIILSNVRSLRSKMDELRINRRFCQEYRDSSIIGWRIRPNLWWNWKDFPVYGRIERPLRERLEVAYVYM